MKANRHHGHGRQESIEPTDPDLSDRHQRALTEYLTVLEDVGCARGAEGLYLVVSGSGREYLVDARTGACGCPDAEHNLVAV